MRILILGASGSIGGEIYNRLSNIYDVYGTFYENKPGGVDDNRFIKYSIADLACLEKILDEVKPDLVISSLTGIFDQQLIVHNQIATLLKETSGRCVYISSANVFDGSPDGSKSETDKPYSISEYGEFKHACEQLLQGKLDAKCLIVRLPRTLTAQSIDSETERIKQGKPIFDNLYMSYNTAYNVAAAIEFCIEKNKSGIVHLSSDDFISQVDFIDTILEAKNMNLSYIIESLTIEAYCQLLGFDNPALLQHNIDGRFYLSLQSNDNEMSTRFNISSKTAVSSVINKTPK